LLVATALPRAVAASAVPTLLALATLNPDRFIADHNIDRYATTGRLDLAYLRTLSVDAVPALPRLAEPGRSRMIAAIVEHERSHLPPACGAGR
jgi:hypothetical protein